MGLTKMELFFLLRTTAWVAPEPTAAILRFARGVLESDQLLSSFRKEF